jgi:catechol 2,3-dioxygenase
MALSSVDMHRPDTQLAASLFYVSLQSPNPEGLAAFYHGALGYQIQVLEGRWLARAPGRNLVIDHGTAKTLGSIGYSVPNENQLAQVRARLDKHGWSFHDRKTEFFAEALYLDDPDGNRVIFGIPDQVAVQEVAGTPSARLQHVVMASRNAQRLEWFFADVLGFTVSDTVVDDTGHLRTSFLRCSHEHHSFAVFQAAENRLDHHCYETTDWNTIRDWCDRLAALHIPIKWGPGRHGPGNNLFIFIHDPDGNWVELSAELESVAHERPAGVWPHEQRTLNSWGEAPLRS